MMTLDNYDLFEQMTGWPKTVPKLCLSFLLLVKKLENMKINIKDRETKKLPKV